MIPMFIVAILSGVWTFVGFLHFRSWMRYTAADHYRCGSVFGLLTRIVLCGPVVWFAAIVAYLATCL